LSKKHKADTLTGIKQQPDVSQSILPSNFCGSAVEITDFGISSNRPLDMALVLILFIEAAADRRVYFELMPFLL